MFTVKEFPGKTFETLADYEKYKLERLALEESSSQITNITAILIPSPKELLEEKILGLEKKVAELCAQVKKPAGPTANKEGIPVGTLLYGESKGSRYTLETLDSGYLCSNGNIYVSLSGAAQGVSGNRRSGWKFWKSLEGESIGLSSGRFKSNVEDNPFEVSGVWEWDSR